MNKLFIFLIVGILMFTTAQAVDITECAYLNTSTDYVVTANITTSGTCFEIYYNTTLTCAEDVWLIGDGSGSAIWTYSDYSNDNMTIQDCHITNFSNGIDLHYTDDAVNINILNNYIDASGYSIEVGSYPASPDSQYNIIGNTIVDGEFFIDECYDSEISDNVLNTDNEVHFTDITNSLIYSNIFNISNTLYIMDTQTGTQYYDNLFDYDTLNSLYLTGAVFNTSQFCDTINIMGDDCIGGNYWSSFTCTEDTEEDGICDVPSYFSFGSGVRIDYLPLSDMGTNGSGGTPTASNITFSCDPTGAGSDCTTQIDVGDSDYIIAQLLDGTSTAITNPLFRFYEDSNDFRQIDTFDTAGSNYIGSTNYSIDTTSCLENDKCISIVKNSATNKISFDKSISKSFVDSNGDFMFSHFYAYIPSQMSGKISAIKVYLGDSSLTNYYSIDMQVSGLSTGWNLITEKWGQTIDARSYSTIGSPSYSSIQKMRIEITYNEYATYTSPILFDYFYAETFKQFKSGSDTIAYVKFNSSGTHNVTIRGEAYGTSFTDYAVFNLSSPSATSINWTTGYEVDATYDASAGSQQLCLNYTSGGAEITTATCYIQTETGSAPVSTYNFATAFVTGKGHCANVDYYINGNTTVWGYCDAVGYEPKATVLNYTTVSNADYVSTSSYINVYSYNYKYFTSDYFSGDYEACFTDTYLWSTKCCTLNSYNGYCQIVIDNPFFYNPTYSSMSIKDSGTTLMNINLLSIKDDVYEQDVYFVNDVWKGSIYYSILDETEDCNATGYGSHNYANFSATGDDFTINYTPLYECISSSCSNRYNEGYIKYSTSLRPFDSSEPSWFYIGGTTAYNLLLLQKNNILCDGSDTTTTYCTEAEIFNSPNLMVSGIVEKYGDKVNVIGIVMNIYDRLTTFGADDYNIDSSNIKMTGSVVRCLGNCQIDIQPCFGTCSDDGKCEPFPEDTNTIKWFMGLFTDNEDNFVIYFMMASVFIAFIFIIVSKNALAGLVGFMGMLMVGAISGVLPSWISATLIISILLLFTGFLFLKAITGGGK